MIVITNGTEYIYLDEEHQIQKTTKRLIREVRQDLERNGYSCIPY